MKKLIFALFAVLAVCVSSCSKYDDSDLWNSVNDLDKRVKTLEELCKQMNTNITSMQTIINAIKDGDYITSITPLTEGGKEVGYTITFSQSPSITIYHGKDGQNGANGSDGKDGITPNISVKKDTDGYYYWTLNGEWILDDSGKKILAQGINGNDGQSGRDGITPQLKIEDGGWYISYDNGQSWNFLGRATGEAGDSMFSNIDTSNPDYVIFTLADGSEIKLARHDELSISFDSEDLIAMQPNSTRSIKYTIAGATGNLKVEVLSSGNVRAKISDNTSATGTIVVKTGATVDEYDKVIMLATDGKTTVMSSLSFEEADYLSVRGGTYYYVEAESTTLSIKIETNTEYTLSIPDEAKSWINIVASRAIRQETITLSVAANEGSARTATLSLLGKDGKSFGKIQITQSGEKHLTIPSNMTAAFPDNWFLKFILDKFDSNSDGVISQQEADNVTWIDFRDYNYRENIQSLEGIQYFQNLTHLYCGRFGMYLTNLDVSKNTALTQLDCSGNKLDALDVSKNTALTQLDCSDNKLDALDVSKNTALTQLYCYRNQLTTLDVSNNTALTELSCFGNQLTTLDVSNNTALTELSCGSNKLTTLDVSKNTALTLLSCGSNQLTTLDVSKNTNLGWLVCDNNQLTTLDVSKNTNLEWLDCSTNKLTTLDASKTRLNSLNTDFGKISRKYHLACAYMSSLKTLYLKTGWDIKGITRDRYYGCIPDQTEIVFVD